MAGFNTAVTGIKATTTALDVAGNNIANASTVGFKASRTEFGDIYSTQVVGAGSSNIPGAGVLVSDLAQDFRSGTIEFTNSNLDLAVNGSGFFQLNDGQGGVTYTRAGAFELDKDGFIVSKNGKYLQGYGLDAQGNQLPLRNLQVEETESPPHATENIALSVNLKPDADVTLRSPYYSRTDTNSFSYTTTVETFDSLGNEHSIKYNYVEQQPKREVHSYALTTPDQAVVSGVTLAPAAADLPVAAGGSAAVDPALRTALEAADPRIDFDTIVFSRDAGGNGFVTFKLKSSATGAGDMIVKDTAAAAAADPALQVLNSVSGNPPLVDSNETVSIALQAAAAGPFDATGNLTAATFVTIGGVRIDLVAGLSIDDVGDTIANKITDIKEADPDIESVTYNSTTNRLEIKWVAEAGDVYTGSPFAVTGGTTDATNVFQADNAVNDGTVTLSGGTINTTTEGDNSYLGVYRLYAYLNEDTLLDIGKVIDPGESGGTAPVNNQAGPTEVGAVVVQFSPTSGQLISINGQTVTDPENAPKLTVRNADPANPGDPLIEGSDTDNLRGLQLDLSSTTRWFDAASIVKSRSQDGYTKGDLIGVTFDEGGKMIASYSNGQLQNLGIVALATFENQAGLQPAGDTEWVATLDSGQATLNPPGTGLNGSLRSAALEQSNVDLSAELVKLIEYQRNYQANSKTLETLNTVTQSILQI